jgi:hypothetical protein
MSNFQSILKRLKTRQKARTHSIHREFGQLSDKRARNRSIHRISEKSGSDYGLNPNTCELHHIRSDKFCGSHNLAYANLNNFIWITNIGVVPIHNLPDGELIPLYERDTGNFMVEYRLNKCKHCFGNRMNGFV